jgi:hypothetical protein
MAKFTSYARPGGFDPIQVPDETNKYLNQGNNAIQSLKQAAAFDIAEKNRQLSALNKNNQLEASNRQFVFQRDTENRQRVQQAILGNYEITARNAETQAINQANFYKQLGDFSTVAVQAATDVTKLVRNAQQERFDLSVQKAGGASVQLRTELTKLGNNFSDEVLTTNPYFQELIHNNGVTTNDIRYLAKNVNSGLWSNSRAVAEALGREAAQYPLLNSDKKFDIDGQQISLAEAEANGLPEVRHKIWSQLNTEAYRTILQPANNGKGFSTAIQQQYINPQLRAEENASIQRTSAKFRSETNQRLANETFQTLDQLNKDGGGALIGRKIEQATGVQRTSLISQSIKYGTQLSQIPGREQDAIRFAEQLFGYETLKDGKLQKFGDVIAGRQDALDYAQSVEQARDRLHQRTIKEAQKPLIDAQIAEAQILAERPPQTREEVEKLYGLLRQKYSGYTSPRLEAILQNETTEAKAVAEMDKNFAKLAEVGLLTQEEMDRVGAPLALRSKYGSIASATSKDSSLNGSYKAQMQSIEDAVKGIPGVVKGPNSVLNWTVGIKIEQLQNRFMSRMATLRTAGNTDPGLATQVAASIIKEFQASPNVSMKAGEFGGFNDILNVSGPNGRATARSRHIFDGLAQASRENRSNTFLDQDGSVYTVSELRDIVEGSKKPGWKPDAMAVEVGRRLGVSPLTVINRQIAARQDSSLPLVNLPQPLLQYQQGVRPEFSRMLERYQTPALSTRAMGSTNTFNAATVPNKLGYNLGELIQTTAAKYNLPPGVLAGLLSHESMGFSEDVLTGRRLSRNSKGELVGAIGIAQFMPGTAAELGVDPLNIPQAIDGAARYLVAMINHPTNPGKSLNRAIQMYNSGPYGVGQSEENRKYFGLVMDQAYKYGHGQALQSRATMRPSMRRFGAVDFERPSSIVFETSSGQPGVDLYFESKQFPAVLDGVVKDVSRESGYGNYVVIESTDPSTGEKVDVLYGHLADGVALRPGQQIEAGDIIGIQGGTGNVRSVDGTIASIDFLAPAPRGSRSMKPYRDFDNLRRYVVTQLQR